MLGLIQRVTQASVTVDNVSVGAIDRGLLLLLAVQKEDTTEVAEALLRKVVSYRVFPDQEHHMNLSLTDIGGGLLIVSQFTLAASTRKGLRPSFSSAAPPAMAEALYDAFVARAKEVLPAVATGRFGADMQVSLINDGPVTFLLEAQAV
jgi:D-aminoacyl-tRNA deacylase